MPKAGTKRYVGQRDYTAVKRSKSNAKYRSASKYGLGKKPKRRTGRTTRNISIKPGKQTKDFLECYGNPFIKPTGSVLPRVPDPENVECTSSFRFQYDTNVSADSTGNGFFICPSTPLALGGLQDFMTNTETGLLNTGTMGVGKVIDGSKGAAVSAASTALATFAWRCMGSLPNSNENMDRQRRIYKEFDQMRYVGAGVRLHDLGAADSQQGELKARQLKSGEFFRYIRDKLLQKIGETTNASLHAQYMRQYQMMAGMVVQIIVGQANTNVTQQVLPAAVDAAWCQQVVADAIQNTREYAGDNGESYILAEGITQRTYTKSAARPFVRKPHDCILSGNDPVPRMADERSKAFAQAYFGAGYAGNLAYTPLNLPNGKQILSLNWNATFQAQANVFNTDAPGGNTGMSANPYNPLLCTNTGEIYGAVEEDDWEGMQGDAGLMMFELQSVGANRNIRLEHTYTGEAVSKGNSVFEGSQSPYDPQFNTAIQVANHWPYVRSGFSFFSDVWSGLKSVGRFVVDHVDDATKIIGAGVKIAQMVG